MVTLQLLVLKTPQLEQVHDFYQTLGIDLTQERHGQGPLHFLGPAGETVFEIYPLSPPATAEGSVRLGFAVPRLTELIQELRGKGAPVVEDARLTP